MVGAQKAREVAQMDDRVRGEVPPVGAAAHLPDLGALEQRGVGQPDGRRLEEGLHHGYAERLAEAAGWQNRVAV